MAATVLTDWRRAAEIDSSLSAAARIADRLAPLKLRPQAYSRDKLFRAMARQETVVFHDFLLRAPLRAFFLDGGDPGRVLKSVFGPSRTAAAKLGPAETTKTLRIHDIIDTWWRGRARLAANDVYFRGSKLERAFDFTAISDFNILHNGPTGMRNLEIGTVLIGTAGCMTDSHSDDPDGCNHCVLGRKLWLAWDREDGRRHGLEDCEYDTVRTRARFDLRTFALLPSARWFTISQGQTVFMPGHLTHKVITLERYLGVSAFYVTLPNALASLTRWKLSGAMYITASMWNRIIDAVIAQLERTARDPRDARRRWGFDHLPEAWRSWRRRYTRTEQERLLAEPRFKHLADAIASRVLTVVRRSAQAR